VDTAGRLTRDVEECLSGEENWRKGRTSNGSAIDSVADLWYTSDALTSARSTSLLRSYYSPCAQNIMIELSRSAMSVDSS
jgi:hypothetical protein